MNSYFKKIKNELKKGNKGMTYVELIVVLSIFSVMTSIVLFNYGDFEENINIKILTNDIALKIVEAQKTAMAGTLPGSVQQKLQIDSSWKPTYGVYFDPSNNKNFIFFTDLLPTNGSYDPSSCSGEGECLESININKGNFISRIDSYIGATPSQVTNPISIVFKRPDSSAIFYSNGSQISAIDYLQITVSSPSLVSSQIRIYPSGRVEIK